MAKTQEELKHLKKECEELNNKLNELSDDELNEVVGGGFWEVLKKVGEGIRSGTQLNTPIASPYDNDSKIKL